MTLSSFEQGAYSVAPWLWPDPNRRPSEYERARNAARCDPPAMRVGSVLLVAVTDSSVSLWGLDLSGADTVLAARARVAWDAALSAFVRVAKVLWQAPDPLLRTEVFCRKVASLVWPGHCEPDERTVGAIDGLSFGLPFLLSVASRLFEVPVPADVAATGAIEPDGSVHAVEAVSNKTRALIEKARGVRRWLVPAENADEAREAAHDSDLEVVPVSSASDALEVVFGDAPDRRLQEVLAEPESRGELVRRLFCLACEQSQLDLDWAAVAQAAGQVAAASGLSQEDAFLVKVSRAVALRHSENALGDMPVPSEQELGAFPAPVRCVLVRQLVQHSADTGVPTFEEAEALAMRTLVRGPEAFREHLMLLGAWGRLLAVCGRPEEALAAELEAVEGLLQRFAWSEVSRPLAMGLRLAGALADTARYERLERLLRSLESGALLSAQDLRFVYLANGAACISMGRLDAPACERLESLATDPLAPSHVQFSALRWAIQHARRRGEPEKAAQLQQRLERHVQADQAPLDARLFYQLVKLDRDPDDLDAILTLKQLDPGPVGHLVRAAKRLCEPAGLWVRRFYPY